MELKFAVLADSANVSIEGKMNLLGVFDEINAPKFPVVHAQMTLALRIEAHPSEVGDHQVRVRIADEDGEPIVPELGVPFKVQKKPGVAMAAPSAIILQLNGVKFPKPGAYSIDILIDGRYEDTVNLQLKQTA